jgi:hypothetical protein
MTHTLALVALFQLAVPNNGTALVSYPTLGYTLSDSHLVRLAGVPGACSASPDVSATAYLSIRSAVAMRAVLLATVGDAPTLIYRTPISDTTVSLTEPPVATALSPTGSYFAALSPSHLWLYRRSGTAPLAALDARWLPVPVEQITALAVGDYGDLVLNTPNGFWYSATPGAPGALFSQISVPVTYLRFTPRDHLLVAFEVGQGRVIALHPTSAFAIEPLITSQNSLSPVTGLEFGADGLSVWITQAAGPLLNYNLSQRQVTPYDAPAGAIASVTAPGVFLWSQPDQHTAILDTTRSVPTVLVVPVAPAEVAK